MASHHLNFMRDQACLSSSHHGLASNEEAKANHERYHQSLLTYKEVPVMRSTKHVELVYKDETMQKFKSDLGDIGDLDYQAMAAALAAEERKTTDQMVSQVIARIPAPVINYDKLASMLSAEDRKTTDQIVSQVLAGIQQPAIDYGKLASFLAAEQKKSRDQIISQAIASIQQPTIDYDKLVIAFDHHSDGADTYADQSWTQIIIILVTFLAAIVSGIMAVKEHREEKKKLNDRYEKLKKWAAEGDKDDTDLTLKESEANDSKERSSEESDGDEDNENNENTTATTHTIKSVPTFTQYVHGPAKPHPFSKQEPTTTSSATASLDKFKVVTDDLFGFKDPAERELVKDMLIDAMVDTMEHGDWVSSLYRESVPAARPEI